MKCLKDKKKEKKKRNGIKTTVKGFEKSAQVRLANIEATGQTHLRHEAKHIRFCLCASQSLNQARCPLTCVCLLPYPVYFRTSLDFFTEYSVLFFSPKKKEPCGDSVRSCVSPKDWSRSKNGLFLVIWAIPWWGQVPFHHISTAEWPQEGMRWSCSALCLSNTRLS